MRKFLRWFMKLFRPDSSGFVRNIQTDTDSGKNHTASKSTAKSRRIVNEKDSLFWVPINKVVEVKKNGHGFTNEIHLASGAAFFKLEFDGDIKVESKKQGLSRVSHSLEMVLAPEDELLKEAKNFEDQKVNISILHLDKYGDGFLYGESKGLSITELEGNKIVLGGSEDNVFYELTQECLKKVIPNKE